jgi:bleomycin hydrolase
MRNINKILLIIGILSLNFSVAFAQGGISSEMLKKIQNSQEDNNSIKALSNAIANISIDDLARTNIGKTSIDGHFSIETPKQNIHDQKSSGRCWMFSGLNVLRSDFARNHGDSITVEYSHAYLFFWDQLEKANLMLQAVADNADKSLDDPAVQFFFKNPLNDGGTFCGVADLAEKYGLVPMSAQPETYSSDNTGRMSRLVSSKLREYGLELRRMVAEGKKGKVLETRKTEMLTTIYKMLTLTLGKPVQEFKYAFRDINGNIVIPEKTYTPKEFYDFTVGKDLNGTFIMVMNDPRREFHKTYEVEYDRHTYDGHNWKYLNLPADEIAQLAINQLKAGRKMYSSYDVGKQSDRKNGYADLGIYDYETLFNTEFPMSKADRIATFDSGSTHAMTLTAVDLDEKGKPLKWKVENSWGPASGADGYLIMSNRWWEEYMFRLVVDKQYVPKNILREYEQKPTMLTPDDPLFDVDH